MNKDTFIKLLQILLILICWWVIWYMYLNRIQIHINLLNGFFILWISIISLLVYYHTYYTEIEIKENFLSKKLIRIKYLTLHRSYVYLIILIISFIGVKLIVQNYTGISVESDLVYYDAKLFLEWLVPYKDFITREPYLLYITSLFLYIFESFSLEIFVNFYLIFSLWTIIVLYKIGTLIWKKETWLILSTLFVFTPFLIKFPSANYQFYGAIYLFFFSLMLFYLFHSLKNKKNIHFFLTGLLLGITVWIYRGSIPFIAIVWFLTSFLLSKEKENFKTIVSKNILTFLGISISLIPPIIYYINILWFTWFNTILSAKFLIIVYCFYFPIILLWYTFYNLTHKKKILQNLFFLCFISIVLWMFFFTEADNTSVWEKIGTINDYIRHLWYFLLPVLLISSNIFFQYLFPKIFYKSKIIYLLNILIIWIIFYGTHHPLRWTSFWLSNNFIFLFYWIMMVYSIIHFYFLEKISSFHIKNATYIFIAFMFIVIYICGNLFFVEWVDHYVINFVIPSIIIIWLFLEEFNISIFIKYVFSISLLYFFSIFYYFNYNIVESSDIKKNTLDSIVLYIQKHTSENEIIFTANPTFVFRSDRNLALNITHPLVYIKNPPYFSDYDPYKLVPSISWVIQYLENNKVQLIIADRRTKALFISDRHKYIQEYILKNYSLQTTIDSVEIYKRN